MTTAVHPHEELIRHVREEFSEVFNTSPQGVYIYLDDPHWTCNEKFATLLGYASAKELLSVATQSSFLDALVAPDSLQRVPEAYFRAANEKIGSAIPVTWKKKNGVTMKSEVIIAPIHSHGNAMVLHFVTAK